MFNKISSKLRSSASSKKQLAPPPQVFKPAPKTPPPTWLEVDDGQSIDSYSASHAESLFPIDDRSSDGRPASVSLNDHRDEFSSFSYSDEAENDHGSARSYPTSSSLPEEGINVGPAVLPDFDQAEEEFLEEFEDYFDGLAVDSIRKEQYSNIDIRRIVHLDYASNPLFSRNQVEEHLEFLLQEGPCSVTLSDSNSSLRNRVSDIEERLLGLFNTNEDSYTLFLTTGLSGSFKLLGEAFPFDRTTRLVVFQDAEEQTRHLVTTAAKSSARTTIAPFKSSSDLTISNEEFTKLINRVSSRLTTQGGLVVIPAQSGLSGNFHSRQWIQQVQSHENWYVAVDVSTSFPAGGSLDLSIDRPSFVLGSLEHALGYPPGLGFLLVKRTFVPLAVKTLKKNSKQQVAGVYVACEDDGFINVMTLVAVASGLDQLERAGVERIQKRVRSLGSWLRTEMEKLRHVGEDSKRNARPMVKLYGRDRGSGVVVFNLVDSTGNLFPPRIVQKLAEKQNVKVGVCGFSSYPFLSGSGSFGEFMAVRLSLGCMSNFHDAYRFVQFLTRFRDEEYMSVEAMGYIESSK